MCCSHCGKQIREGRRICPFCGGAVDAGEAARAAPFAGAVGGQRKKPETDVAPILLALLFFVFAISQRALISSGRAPRAS